jgi:hypothetical protein
VVTALQSRGAETEDDIMTTSLKRSPRHLSDTALILLGRAADSEDQMLLPIPKTVKAHGKALERVLRSLLNQGFVEEVLPATPDYGGRWVRSGTGSARTFERQKFGHVLPFVG